MSQTIAPAPNPKPQTLIHGPKPSWSLQVLGTLNLSSFTCTPTKNARLVFVVCGFGVCGLWFGVCGFGLGFVAHTFQFAPLSSPFSVQSSSHLPPSDIPKTLAPGASIAQATPKAAPPPPPLPSLHIAAVGSFCCRPCCATHVNFAFSSLSFVHIDIIFRYLPLHQLTLLCLRQARPVAPSSTRWCWISTAKRFLGFGVWGLGFVVL